MKAALYERGHHGLPGRGTWYLLTSGMTGYLPNQSEAAVSERIEGPYTPVGGPHPADAARTSWHSQISQVFAAADGTLLSIADRWVPRRQLDQKEQEILIRTVASAQKPERYSVTEEERAFPRDGRHEGRHRHRGLRLAPGGAKGRAPRDPLAGALAYLKAK